MLTLYFLCFSVCIHSLAQITYSLRRGHRCRRSYQSPRCVQFYLDRTSFSFGVGRPRRGQHPNPRTISPALRDRRRCQFFLPRPGDVCLGRPWLLRFAATSRCLICLPLCQRGHSSVKPQASPRQHDLALRDRSLSSFCFRRCDSSGSWRRQHGIPWRAAACDWAIEAQEI